MKVDIYNIFNEIQTDTNTKDNLTKLIGFFEKKKTKEFIEIIEQVILMIYKYHDKNNAALKNIKDFLKRFLETGYSANTCLAPGNLRAGQQRICRTLKGSPEKGHGSNNSIASFQQEPCWSLEICVPLT